MDFRACGNLIITYLCANGADPRLEHPSGLQKLDHTQPGLPRSKWGRHYTQVVFQGGN